MATQEIGIPIDLSKGIFNNTVFLNGKLQLIELAKDDNDVPIYPPEGYWISESIRVADKVTSFKYIAKSITGSGSYKIYTQSSPNGFTWSEWQEINYTNGSILTPVGYYAKIKIFIYAGNTNVTFTIDDFAVVDKYINPYINSSYGVLELKKSYTSPLVIDGSWADDGVLMKSSVIQKTNYKKIDKIEISTQ
ncbi:hypothetical protein SAMN04487895_101774 [Paenibacillus sophorae]|uniref:Uncharacterized protein n=1 Tax=Paenibacillus sophorae TaxID=1333845 RepID=A0A1H8H735_9BACL|nr:hypothetical protein [Paenibacillus sophorae]QWU14464.1 hypothetical protein KP014_21385 [Paenibacillus sophorae]SEN51935.1 hypothetical protein SAMN04487895_101774 [Paenibacillus sophorae]